MTATTFNGNIRSGIDPSKPYGVTKLVAKISVSPIQTSAGTGFVLPAGSIITGITSLGGATGGVSPTIDVGISGSAAAICNELDADTAGTAGTLGASGWTELSADTEVFAGVGASAATGGTTTFLIEYFRTDTNR